MDRAGGLQQGQQQRQGPGIAVFAKDAQPLHALVMAGGVGLLLLLGQAQQLQALVAFGGHIRRGRLAAVQVVEGIAQQLLGQLLGEHLGI